MKNVKFGFQFAIGFYTAKALLSIPEAMRHPRVKRECRRLKEVIRNCQDREDQNETDEIKNSVFPQCKNKIGFATD